MDEIGRNQLKELLLKCWMTHDGMWFLHCMKELGIEKANALNKAAIGSLAPLEIDRVRAAFGLDKIETPQDIRTLCDAAFGLLSDKFMGFDYTFPSENVMRWEMKKCFAHSGMTRLGVIDQYECGVVYRVACWFDAVGIRYDQTPRIDRCLMHLSGSCRGEFIFSAG